MVMLDDSKAVGEVTLACAICGEASEQCLIGSLPSLGEPDLDLRPAEMLRSTIDYALHVCPTCGYCGLDLSQAPAIAAEVVASEAFQAQVVDPEFPDPANGFLCLALLDEADGRFADAAWATLSAAWVCDDNEAPDLALACRRHALERLCTAIATGQPLGDDAIIDDLLLVDLLRRTGQFDAALDACLTGQAHAQDEVIAAVFIYQHALIEAGDTDCHTIDEALSGVLGW